MLKIKTLKKGLAKKLSKVRKPSKKGVLLTLLVVSVLALFYFCKSLVFAVWVGKRPISRFTVIRELEKQGGKQVLTNLIEESLILQEADKNNIKVGVDEVNNEIVKIEALIKSQGLSLDEALNLRNQTRNDLVDQVRIQKIVEKLLSPKITVTDEEVKAYFDKNKAVYGSGANYDKLKDQIKSQIIQQKLADEYKNWIADIKAKAKIFYFINY